MNNALDLNDFLAHLKKRRADYTAAAERTLRDHHANQGALLAVNQLIADIQKGAQAHLEKARAGGAPIAPAIPKLPKKE